MKKSSFVIILLFLFITNMKAQSVVNLWDSIPPTDNGLVEPEVVGNGFVSGISKSEMIVYLPDSIKNKKMAVIICPGGAYVGVAIDHEGHQFAEWLASEGIAAIILKSRMPSSA